MFLSLNLCCNEPFKHVCTCRIYFWLRKDNIWCQASFPQIWQFQLEAMIKFYIYLTTITHSHFIYPRNQFYGFEVQKLFQSRNLQIDWQFFWYHDCSIKWYSGYNHPSKSKYWKLFWVTLSGKKGEFCLLHKFSFTHRVFNIP